MRKLILLVLMFTCTTVIYSQVIKPVNLENAGTLSVAFSEEELNTVTDLTITGSINARDFKTMRDLMPVLANIDLSGATIAAYTGNEGTSISGNISYVANTVPEYAFMNASYNGKNTLISIKFPNSMIDIGYQSFRNCFNLKEIFLPSSILYIRSYAFARCINLKNVSIPASLTSMSWLAFADSPVYFTVDENNSSYSSVDGILFNKQKSYLFQSPPTLSGIYSIPKTVETIGHYAFSGCSGITEVNIPSSVKYINDGAFTACEGISNLTIPISVTTIGNYAFQSCYGLRNIYAPWIVPITLGNSAFANINKAICNIYVPFGSKAAYQAANQWKEFQNIVEIAEVKKTYVPDDNFEQALIDLGYDSGVLDDYVPTSNISGLTNLDVSNKGINDLTGIQDFISLIQLNCGINSLTTIDISKNINLQILFIYSNQLTSLDVSNNTNLQQIYGNNNLVSNLDLSKNPSLNTLDFGNNKLTSLDLSQNPYMTILNCTYNQISSIDLSGNLYLQQIAVGGNPISSLDISKNLQLRWFYVYSTNLTSIDCSNHPELASIDCSRNSLLSSLNLKNGNNAILNNVFAIENPMLSCIQVDDPPFATTNVNWKKDATASYSSDCNPKTYVPDDNFEQALISLGYDSGILDNYVLTAKISSVTTLNVSGKNIADLTGIEAFTNLQTLNCYGNKLSQLNISNNLSLVNLLCDDNLLTSIDVTKNTELISLSFSRNYLMTSIDVSKNLKLNTLWCDNNKITSLNLVNNPLLATLYCNKTLLLSLDISKNLKLLTFDATGNPNLFCIQVYDKAVAETKKYWKKDTQASYSTDCTPPVTNAGTDQTVNENTLVTLDGSASFDPNGNSLTYIWNAPEGIVLIDANTPNPSFTAPEVSFDTEIELSLAVSDGTNYSNTDAVTVKILQVNKAPIAHAGADQLVNAEDLVTLDGTLSSDPDGDILNYSWIAPSDISLNLTNPAKPTFTAPGVTVNSIYKFTLIVNDGALNSVFDDVFININSIYTPKVKCNNIEINLNSTGSYALTNTDLRNLTSGTTDDVDSYKKLVITAEPNVYSCSDIGTPIQTKVTVTDLNNNSSYCYSTINVFDLTPPVFSSVNKSLNVSISKGESYTLPDLSETYPANDACGKITYMQTPAPGKLYTTTTRETINIKATDEFGNVGQINISLILAVKARLKSANTEEIEIDNFLPQIEIYPNPTTGIVNMVSEGLNGNISVEVFTSSGVSVLKNNVPASPFQIDLSDKVEGVYFINVTSENKSKVFKTVLKK